MSNALTTDVALSDRPGSGVRVGVLSFHNSKETKAILNAIGALGHVPLWLCEDNIRVWMQDGELHFDPMVDVVVNRLLATKADRPLDDLGLASSYLPSRPVLNPPGAVIRAMHKFGAATVLAAAGLPVPDAYLAFSHRTMEADQHPIDGRVVHKPAIGTNGNRISLLGDGVEATHRIARRRAFLQEFLTPESDQPSDIRVYVVNGAVIGAMKRYAPPDEWRTNVALGGAVEDVSDSLPDEARDYAIRAAEVFDLDFAGVDLLHRHGAWYVLEVNATAGFKGFFDATGVSPAPAIAKVAIQRGGGVINEDELVELRNSLDDSIPNCKPTHETGGDRRETVGFTERVTLAGDRRLQRVTAKADTGAKRTSIDLDLAADLGAGCIVGTTRVRSGSARARQKRPLVNVDLKIGSRWLTTIASIEDRNHMTYPVLLGRDVLRGYRVDIQRRVDED